MKKAYEKEGINYFWTIKNSTEIWNKLKAKGFQVSTISSYNFLRCILRYHTIVSKINLLIWLKIRLDGKKFFIWPATKDGHFRFQRT